MTIDAYWYSGVYDKPDMGPSSEEKKFKAIFKNSLDAIVINNKKGLIIEANPAARKLFSRKNIIGKPISSFINGSLKEIRGEVTYKDVYLGYSKSTGFVKGTRIFFFRDITDLKTEEKRREHFLVIAGHELKNPLAVIKALTHLISKEAEKSGDGTRILSFTGRIDEKVNTLTGLINDLLDITRIRQGQIPLRPEKTKFTDLVKKVVREFTITNSTHTVVISGNTSKTLYLDRDRISQVIINLLRNAVKYSPIKKNIFIEIKSYPKKVLFSIKDEGIGIAKEEQNKVFELYYRHVNPEGFSKGLGVGLFISKEIIRAHKGKIWFKSELNQGSQFFFTLPANLKKHDTKNSITYR